MARQSRFYRYKNEADIIELNNLYRFYIKHLYEKIIHIFEWENLPEELPAHVIEEYLMERGQCGLVRDPKWGYVAVRGNPYGITPYRNEWIEYVGVVVEGGKKTNWTLGKDAVLIRNNALCNDMNDIVEIYASELAHAKISVKDALLATRMCQIVQTPDTNSANTLKEVFQNIYNGLFQKVFVDRKQLAAVSSHMLTENIPDPARAKSAVDVEEMILRQFFAEIGINMSKDKKERMVADEVGENSQMLLFNIIDMLRQRQKAAEEINRVFGLNVSVHLAPDVSLLNGEDVNNPETETDEAEETEEETEKEEVKEDV